jgi:hypothetical protein
MQLVKNLSVEEASELLHLPELLLDYVGVMMLEEAVKLCAMLVSFEQRIRFDNSTNWECCRFPRGRATPIPHEH